MWFNVWHVFPTTFSASVALTVSFIKIMCVWFTTLWANSISINRAVYTNILVTTRCTLLASEVSVMIGKPTMTTRYTGDICCRWMHRPRLYRWFLSLLTCRYWPALKFGMIVRIKKFNMVLVITPIPKNHHHMEKLKEREKEINCGGRASELVTRTDPNILLWRPLLAFCFFVNSVFPLCHCLTDYYIIVICKLQSIFKM